MRKYLITEPSICQVLGLADKFALVRLAPRSKRPVEQSWQAKPAPNREAVAQWLADGYGIGLRLGQQPSGDFLVAIDVDSPKGAAWLRAKGGVPVCPVIQSNRGPKYILKLPHRIRLSKIVPTQGIEILGEGCQIVLPTPNAPDDRFWVISPEELNWEIPYPHEWLLRLIREHGRRARREMPAKRPYIAIRECGGISEAPSTQARLGRGLGYFITEILPARRGQDSNHPALLGAAIVAHKIDRLRGDALVAALGEVNQRLSPCERESKRQLWAIARCVQRAGYGFNARVYAERTGTDYRIARLIYGLLARFDRDRANNQGVYMPREEITTRIQRTIALKGRWIAQGVALWDGSLTELAQQSGVKRETIRSRLRRGGIPLVVADLRQGVSTRLIFAWTPLQFSILSTWVNSLKYLYGLGVLGDVGAEGGRGEGEGVRAQSWGYRIRDGP
jgi:hypothetical protein